MPQTLWLTQQKQTPYSCEGRGVQHHSADGSGLFLVWCPTKRMKELALSHVVEAFQCACNKASQWKEPWSLQPMDRLLPAPQQGLPGCHPGTGSGPLRDLFFSKGRDCWHKPISMHQLRWSCLPFQSLSSLFATQCL